MSIGESGYLERVQAILKASQAVADGISDIPGIRLLGSSQAPTMIVCFDTRDMEIYRVGGKMTEKGWELNALQSPPCLHLCVTMNTIPYVDKFISDLRDSVDEVQKEGPDVKRSGSAAMYGMAGSLPAGPVNEILRIFTDQTLTP
jgi:sphinganine-1-phosphate aldolase